MEARRRGWGGSETKPLVDCVGRERGSELEGQRVNIPVLYTSQNSLEDPMNNTALCK